MDDRTVNPGLFDDLWQQFAGGRAVQCPICNGGYAVKTLPPAWQHRLREVTRRLGLRRHDEDLDPRRIVFEPCKHVVGPNPQPHVEPASG